MTRSLTFTALLTVAALPASIACTPAAGANHPGDPLFSVSGQMTTRQALSSTQGPIRLAVGWYANRGAGSAPLAIVTQELTYQGSFPLNYTFSLYDAPPAKALSDFEENGASTRAAWGIVLPYQDLNGNAQLDPIPVGGMPIDRVLGSSIGDFYNGAPSPQPTYIAYVEGPPPASWSGFKAGYNLYVAGAVVPTSTPLPLDLTFTSELDLLVCEALLPGAPGLESTVHLTGDHRLACNVAPTGGVRVTGSVAQYNGYPSVDIEVSDGTAPLSAATVTLNGDPLVYSVATRRFEHTASTRINAPGANELRVTPPGQPTRVFTMTAPGEFALSTPTDQARIFGGPLSVRWAAATGAQFYKVTSEALATPVNNEDVYVRASAATEATTLNGVIADDYHQVSVAAFAPGYRAMGTGGSSVITYVMQGAFLHVFPASSRLFAEGIVGVEHVENQTSNIVSMQVFDGLSAPLSSASVTVNGRPLTFDFTDQTFSHDGSPGLLRPGAVNTVTLQSAGAPDASIAVALPTEFTVSVPSSVRRGDDFTVSWSAASGAGEYVVFVTDSESVVIQQTPSLGTTATINGLPSIGTYSVFIEAYSARRGAGRHLPGVIRYVKTVTATR